MNPEFRTSACDAGFRRQRRRSTCKCIAAAAIAVVAVLLVGGASLAHSPGAGEEGPSTTAPAVEMPSQPTGTDAPPARTDSPVLRNEPATELSVGALLKRADLVVQLVMTTLVAASIACWTIFLTKLFEVTRARRRLTTGLDALGDTRFLDESPDALGSRSAGSPVLERLIEAAIKERHLSEGLLMDGTVVDRFLLRASEIVRDEARQIAAGTGLLATIGATAPFVGLFGTVWGIMNSFMGIARAQTTNLAVVAPGIAEALLATAMGLVAAIPAVIFYNLVARATKAYVEQAAEGSGVVVRLLSRTLARPEARFSARAAE